MDRATVEAAIRELDDLIDRDEDDEAAYQAWFERHTVAFVALGYQERIPHPRVVDSKGATYIPDFFARRGPAWELFELKTPQTRVLIDKDRRSKFYSEFEEYVSQVREYSKLFGDPRVIASVRTAYGATLSPACRATIVAGRSIGLDDAKLLELAGSRIPPLEIMTFDDLRSRLIAYSTFAFAEYETAFAAAFIAVVVPRKPPVLVENNFLFDVGDSPNRDRIACFINPQGYLSTDVYDSDGVLHSARALTALTDRDYGRMRVLIFEVGIGDGLAFLSISLDRRYRIDLRLSAFPLSLSVHRVIGSDIRGAEPSYMCLGAHLDLRGTPDFEQRRLVQQWADEHHASDRPDQTWVVFTGRQSLRTVGHPFASFPSTPPTRGPCPS